MSYSISKTNYIINANSFGKNRSQRGSTDFGIYEPSTESAGAEPSFPTRVLEGPQVTFGDTTATSGSDRAPPLPETNILQSATIEQIQELPNFDTTTLRDSIVDALNYYSPARRATRATSANASTALGRNIN
jgi:hypothetical protein